MARLKAAASLRQQQLPQLQQAASGKLFKHVPARLPPSQQAINRWLVAETAGIAAADALSSKAAQAAAGSGFVMDANTGRLVPLQASSTQVSPAFSPSLCDLLGSCDFSASTEEYADATSNIAIILTTDKVLMHSFACVLTGIDLQLRPSRCSLAHIKQFIMMALLHYIEQMCARSRPAEVQLACLTFSH